jgi:GT2 family glycosyltransferase
MEALPKLSIIVNYFNPREDIRILRMTIFALQSIKSFTKNSFELLLVDGTGLICCDLERFCSDEGWKYLPTVECEEYAVTFNRGLKLAQGAYCVLIASDIFVSEEWDSRLLAEMERTNAWMVAPYLSFADSPSQVWSFPLVKNSFEPVTVTFNLNLLSRECIERIGGLDERFSGCFNDIDYLVRIRRAGGRVVISDVGHITHLGKGTTSKFTLVNYERDHSRFIEKYPELTTGEENKTVNYAHRIFAKSFSYRFLLKFIYHVRLSKSSSRLHNLLMRFEPVFHCI